MHGPGTQVAPRARRDGVIAESLDDDMVVYEAETGTAHRLDSAAAKVWQMADGTRSVAEIANLAGLTQRTVTRALARLQAGGLLAAGAAVPRRWVPRRGTTVRAA